MTTVVNNNLRMIDRPQWEQLTTAPASTATGVAIVDDNVRYIYAVFSATSFWAYDTWADTWIQLPNLPGGTLAAGSCLRFTRGMGGQVNGEVFGSIYALIASGTAVTFYRYDVASATWSSLSSGTVPATWGTDGRLVYPEPYINGWQGGYHSNVSLNTVTTTAAVAAGVSTIPVSALPLGMPAGAVLNFGTAAAPIYAVLSASAAAAATSISVYPLISAISSGAVAYWYDDMFLVGNNATVMYRYSINGNAWATTSDNSGNPTLGAVPAAPGAGMVACWLPGSGDTNALDRLILIRGGGASTIYEYSFTNNTWSTVSYNPSTETFGAGSSSGARADAATGKNCKLIMQKDATGRLLEFDRKRARMDGKCTQNLIAQGTAVVGDKTTILRSPDGVEFLYSLINTGSYFLRTALFF